MQESAVKRDETLVALAKSGDSAATEELLYRYKGLVRGCARKFSFRLVAEVDDLVQEGMIGLNSAIASFSPEAGKSFKNFAYTCVSRKICSYLRTANRAIPEGERADFDVDLLSGESATPEERLLDSEADAEFRLRLMKTLSDFEFRVVTMYLEGMSYAQIAEVTGKAIKSIDNALARSKKKLQQAFR